MVHIRAEKCQLALPHALDVFILDSLVFIVVLLVLKSICKIDQRYNMLHSEKEAQYDIASAVYPKHASSVPTVEAYYEARIHVRTPHN